MLIFTLLEMSNDVDLFYETFVLVCPGRNFVREKKCGFRKSDFWSLNFVTRTGKLKTSTISKVLYLRLKLASRIKNNACSTCKQTPSEIRD